MPYFDRFDICEAYAALEYDWNSGGILRERGRNYSVGAQLARMGFRAGPTRGGYDRLPTENSKEIYLEAAARMGLIPSADESHVTTEDDDTHCAECGEELDRDCFGRDRCAVCDGPCPECGQ